MPSVNFVLPLWLYWVGLALFPAVAMYFVRRERRQRPAPGPSLFIAYLFWLCAGFLGIHRFYLRNLWGFAFIALFLTMLSCNTQVRTLRDAVSSTNADVQQAERDLSNASPAQNSAAQQTLDQKKRELQATRAAHETWFGRTRVAGAVLGAALVLDALLLPGLVRRRRALEQAQPGLDVEHAAPPPTPPIRTGEDPTLGVHSRITDAIEWLNTRVGEYVAYWAVIAVFAYYYEVLARYVFNSPSNWVHESMFLMFGMQYLLCGAFTYCADQHVRVDVLYVRFSNRGKAVADIITSLFFFTFVLTMLWTGILFAGDAIKMGEHSFTEWAVQYWPVKLAIPIGAALLALQGLAKLIKDILILVRGKV